MRPGYVIGKKVNSGELCPHCNKHGLELHNEYMRLTTYRCRYCGAEYEYLG